MSVAYRLPFAARACASMNPRCAISDSISRSRCIPQRSFHALNQSREHLLHIDGRLVQGLGMFGNQKSQILRQQNKINQFVRRPRRDMEKLPKLRVRTSSASLCYICRNGRRRPPHLADQPKPFRVRISDRCAVDIQSEQVTLLPDFEIFEILHYMTSFSTPKTSGILPHSYITDQINNRAGLTLSFLRRQTANDERKTLREGTQC